MSLFRKTHIFLATELSPKNVGAFHTEIFTKFGEMHFAKKEQDIKYRKEDDFLKVMSSYCENGDKSCLKHIYSAREHTQRYIRSLDPRKGRVLAEYPEAMDEALKSALENVFSVLGTLNEDNINDVLEMIKGAESDIESISDVDPMYRDLALSAVSVGMESTKLWHSVYFDENSRLSGICGAAPIWTLPFVIGADIIGVLMIPVSFLGGAGTFLSLLGYLACTNFGFGQACPLADFWQSSLLFFAAILYSPQASFFACDFLDDLFWVGG